MDAKKIIASLKSVAVNNNVNDIVIRNINVTEMSTYARVAITLDKPVKGMIQNPNFGVDANTVPTGTNVTDEYIEGPTNVIFVSNFSLIANLREIPEVAFAGNTLLEKPKAIGVILSGAKISVLQEAVAEGQEYKNPFSDNPTPMIVKHNSFYNHVYDIHLSDFGEKMVMELAKHIMFD